MTTTNPTPADPGYISPAEIAELIEDVRLARLILGRTRTAAAHTTWGILAGIAAAGAAVLTDTAWLLNLAGVVTIVSVLATAGLTILAAFLGDPPDPDADDRLAAWFPDHDTNDRPEQATGSTRAGSRNPRYQ